MTSHDREAVFTAYSKKSTLENVFKKMRIHRPYSKLRIQRYPDTFGRDPRVLGVNNKVVLVWTQGQNASKCLPENALMWTGELKRFENASVDAELFIRFRSKENGGFQKRISVDVA